MKTRLLPFALLIIGFLCNFPAVFAASGPVGPSEKSAITATTGIKAYAEGSPPAAQDAPAADMDEFPNLHPLVVHFPVVLLIFAVLLQLIQLFVMKRTMDWVVLFLIGSGFIGAYVAANFVHPDTEGLTATAKQVLETHDKYAMWALWSSALAAVMKIVSLFWYKLKRGFEIAVFVVMAFSAYAVAQAGHYGSQLVYIEGVGPQGQYMGSEGEGHDEH